MKFTLFFLVPVICLLGCGDSGPVCHNDAGEDASDNEASTDSGDMEDGSVSLGSESSPVNCDCYTCPYGLDCRPNTDRPSPNPSTVYPPSGHTQM